MYYFKTELKKQFLDGRRITHLAEKVGINSDYLVSILNAKRGVPKQTAFTIVKMVDFNYEIEDYFAEKGE